MTGFKDCATSCVSGHEVCLKREGYGDQFCDQDQWGQIFVKLCEQNATVYAMLVLSFIIMFACVAGAVYANFPSGECTTGAATTSSVPAWPLPLLL